jgi:amidase
VLSLLVSSLDFDLTTILTIFCFAVHMCRPITRTVSDAVHVLEAIVGYDPRDAEATRMASKYIPERGYKQFLNVDGLRGKRLGILRKNFFCFPSGSVQEKVFNEHFEIMR